jgi:hypothetical protein
MWLIAIMLMASGLTRIIGAATYHSIVPGEWFGWFELVAACALFMLSAHIWYMLLGGYLLFGFAKFIVFLIIGQSLSARHVLSPRLDVGIQAAFALLAITLLFQFFGIWLNIVDRIALTIYMFTFFQFGNIAVQSLGIIALAISWGIRRLIKHRNRRYYQEAVS